MRSAVVGVMLVALLVGLAPQSSAARLVESWPYEKLLKESDLVVIATATGTKDNVRSRNSMD